MAKKSDPVHAGRYYGVTHQGRMLELGDVAVPPDAVLCRRVADFPHGTAPPGAHVEPCRSCGAPIAFNPAGPHRQAPRECLQCAGVVPDPIT
jgi:hypothetical protein